jgi:hypothetical protein
MPVALGWALERGLLASVSTTIAVFSANLGPAQTTTFVWKNPNINAIYAFSAVPHSTSRPLTPISNSSFHRSGTTTSQARSSVGSRLESNT